jgi:hypothetical protein
MRQGALKSVGWIGRPLLTMPLSIAGIAVPSCRSSGLYARSEKGKYHQLEELRAMQQCRLSARYESRIERQIANSEYFGRGIVQEEDLD